MFGGIHSADFPDGLGMLMGMVGGALTLCSCHEMDAYLLQIQKSKVVSTWKISAYQSWFCAKSLHRHLSKISGCFDSHVSIVHLHYASIFCIKLCVGLVEWKRKCGNVASQEAQPTPHQTIPALKSFMYRTSQPPNV